MVQKITKGFNKIYDLFIPSNKLILRSCGLISVAKFICTSGLAALLDKRLRDTRQRGKIKFPLSELVVYVILQILDGGKRFSQFAKSPNLILFREMFRGKVPHPTVILNAFKDNPLLKIVLAKILLRYSLATVVEHTRKNKIRKLIIDMDQSGNEIHGRQENVQKGYFALKAKNTKGFQFRLWIVRELKIILKVNLLPGSAHSQTNVTPDFKLVLRTLKKAGIIGVFVGDSGFFSEKICKLIHQSGHELIFSVPQHNTIRQRGKNAKKKQSSFAGRVTLKERWRSVDGVAPHCFREIFIQVLSNDGQLWFDFAADHFTNVLITNQALSAEEIYQFYRSHAVIETVIEEMKNDFAAASAHAHQFSVNSAMTVVSALAYNIKNGFIDSKKIHRLPGQRMRLATLQARWLHIPGVLVHRSNRKVLHLPKSAYDDFCRLEKVA